MKYTLLRAFWGCGDSQTIEYALLRARLNKLEKEVLIFSLDECMTQEEIAERLNYSTRRIQQLWQTATDKVIGIPWVRAYAEYLLNC